MGFNSAERMSNLRLYIVGIVISTFPIFSLYSINHMSVSFLMMLMCYVFVVPNKLYALNSKYVTSIRVLAFALALLSLNGLTIGYQGFSLVFAVIMLLLTMFVYLPIIGASNQQITYRCLSVIGYLCCFVAFYQLYSTITGAPYFNGRLPYFELDSSIAGWMENNFGFRINSLFSEPSYFSIYLLPIFAYSLKNKFYINSVFFGLGIVLSSSSMGILCMAGVVIYEMVYKKGIQNRDYKSLFIVSLAVVLIVFIIQRNQEVISILQRSSSKIEEIGEGSGESRLFGGRELFWMLPTKESLFGVGLSQMENYFKMRGIIIPNYANTPVTVLINSGIVGLFCLLVFYYKVFMLSKKNDTIIYFLIFLAISCADPLLYNQRFYHLLFFVYFMGNTQYAACNKSEENH